MKSSGLDTPRLEPRWDPPGERFERWCLGLTGFDLVDGGMRQLAGTGWMHNRARMVTASFLVKHLHVDWRHGEAWFAGRLVDYDPAENEGNWQWYCRRRLAKWGTDENPRPMLDLAAEAAEAKERYRAASR